MSAAPESRYVVVPGKREPIEVRACAGNPAIVWVKSNTVENRWYEVREANTPHARCNCQASSFGNECSHVVAAMEYAQEARMSAAETHDPTPIRSLVPAQNAGLGLRQDMQGRAVALRKQSALYSNTYTDLATLALGMFDAKLLPAGMKPEAAAIVMMKAGELGIPPISAFEFLYVVGNKVCLQGQMVMALVQRSGLGTIQVTERSAQQATAVGKRPGYEPLRVTVTKEEATKMGVRNMDKFPADMLTWKAVARVGRLLFAELLGGMDVSDASGNVVDSVADEGDYVVEPPYGGGDAVPGGYAANEGDSTPSDDSDVMEGSYTPLSNDLEGEGTTSPSPPPTTEPDDPPAAYPWAADFTTAITSAPIGVRDVYQMLGVAGATKADRAKAIDSWLNPAIGSARTPADLVKFVADWKASQT